MVVKSKFLGILIAMFILNSIFASANQDPVLNLIGGKQVDEGQSLEFTATASDQDNDTVTFSKNDSRGSLDQNTGYFSWTPGFSESGIYFIQFTASDGTGESSEIIIVNVTEIGNHPPILGLIGGKQVLEGQLLELEMSASDPDSDALAFSTNSSSGTLNSAAGEFSWQTDFDDAGIYFVLFSVSDGSEASAEIIMVNVTEAGNHAPQISIIQPTGMPASGNITIEWSAADADNDALEFSAYLISRIYEDGVLTGEDRAKVCSTMLSNCIFDTVTFADGNYSVAVTANDSFNYTEVYSNDFAISNGQQDSQISAQAETQKTNDAQPGQGDAPSRIRTHGDGVPPPFWWLGAEPEQNGTSETEGQQSAEDAGLQNSSGKNESIQSSVSLSTQQDVDVMGLPVSDSGPKITYAFAWMALLILIVPIAYVPYNTLSSGKLARLQSSIKKKAQNAIIKAGSLHKFVAGAHAKKFW